MQHYNRNSDRIAVFVGKNGNGESGLGHTKPLKHLTILPFWIERIHSGNGYTIYSALNHQIIYSAGSNHHGACGVGDFQSNVTKHRSIKYFKENNLAIDKICVSPVGTSTFWITTNGKVYGNGSNNNHQLGVSSQRNKSEPVRVRDLRMVDDIQSSLNYSIALVSERVFVCIIVHHWTRVIFPVWAKPFPTDLVDIITAFTNNNKVYTTEHAHGTNVQIGQDRWSLLLDFKDVNVVQIATGSMHSLFLDASGCVWSCGSNVHGQLGYASAGARQKIKSAAPKQIEFFVRKGIQIKTVRCGAFHNLAVATDGTLYSWGFNEYGQCGSGSGGMEPKVVRYGVVAIECGYHHSYCRTMCGGHYLFGKNAHNECLDEKRTSRVSSPFCINWLQDRFGGDKRIESVSLGSQNTKIVLKKITTN